MKAVKGTYQCGHSAVWNPNNGTTPVLGLVNGVDAKPNEHPWTALIVKPGAAEPFCSGAVIAPEWVLTSGVCCQGIETTATVHVGVTSINNSTGTVSSFASSDIDVITGVAPTTARSLTMSMRDYGNVCLMKLKSEFTRC